MLSEKFCLGCGQSLSVAKRTVWQLAIRRMDGSSAATLAQAAGEPRADVLQYLNELYLEGKVYFVNGKWYPEADYD